MSLKSSSKIDTNICELEITIDAETFTAAVKRVYAKKKSSINVPGFRKGKAPLPIIERIYGKDVFYEDALEMLYPETVEAAYIEGNIQAVDSPHDLDVKEIGENGVRMTMKVTVKPEVSVEGYKGLEGEKTEPVVTDEDVDAEIERMRERNSRIVAVEGRPAQNGDIVVIDYEGFADGKAFEGGKEENRNLTLGKGGFIPGFEDGILGRNAGEEFEVNVTFPEDYHEGLAGKAAVFKMKLHEIKVKELPELDDEFAKDLGEYETVDDLKKATKEDLLKKRVEESDKAFEDSIIEMLGEKVVAEIPEVMIRKKAEDNTESFSQNLSRQGVDLDTYFMYTGTSKEDFDASMLESARRQVRILLALEKVAELEGIEAAEEDYEAQYSKLSEIYHMEIDKIKGVIGKEVLRQDIVNEKTVKFIVEHAKAVPPAAPKKKNAGKKSEDKTEEPAAKKKPATKKESKKDEK